MGSPLDAARAAPDDREIYAVLGDWLQARGEPHGELIALELRGDRSPTAGSVAGGALADPPGDWLAPRIAELQHQLAPAVHGLRLDWRWGYVWRAHVGTHVSHTAVRALVAAPHGALIRELVIEECEQRWIDLLGELAPQLPVLRSLVLERGHARHPVVLGALWAALPQLERAIDRTMRRYQPIAPSNVRELAVNLMMDDDYTSWRLPALELLDVGQIANTAALAALDPAQFPRLRQLSANTTRGTPEAIAAMPIGAQLGVIDLWREVDLTRVERLVVDRRPAADRAALLVTGGTQMPLGTCVDAEPAGAYLGRAKRVVTAVCLDSDAAREARIDRDKGRWRIADIARRQTRVNGRLLDDPTPLVDGDEITIGANAIRFFTSRERAERERTRLGLPHPSHAVA